MAYTVGRFWIELMRSDPAHSFLGLRVNGWVSILAFLGALLYFVRVRGPQQRLTFDEDGTVRVLPADGEAPAIGGTDEAAQPADDGTGSAERAVVEDDVDEEKSDAAPRP